MRVVWWCGLVCAALATVGCEDGAQGPPGEQGPMGPDGAPGAVGDEGVEGADGVSNTTPGADGADGAPGVDGIDGLACWDADDDGACAAGEDLNNDSACDVLDCEGPAGGQGDPGGGVSSCSRFSGTGTAGCPGSGDNRLVGGFCSCAGAAEVSSQAFNTPAGNIGGSLTCGCTTGSASVDVFCCS